MNTYGPRSLRLVQAWFPSDLFPEPAAVAAKSDLEWMGCSIQACVR